MLVKVPHKLLRVGNDALRLVGYQRNEMRMKRAPNSVDSLAPNDLVMLALQKMPLTPGIPHHVICGDRGKGGHKDRTKPVMSDGVVPYWSSHMETAQSELIVPSGHDAHQNPQASRRWSAFSRCTHAAEHEENGKTQYVTVLELPAVDSAEIAVKVAIAAKAKDIKV